MKTTKLKLNKFKIAKLTGTHHVRGGEQTNDCDPTFTGTTDPAAAQQPGCILTSRQFVEVDPPATGGEG